MLSLNCCVYIDRLHFEFIFQLPTTVYTLSSLQTHFFCKLAVWGADLRAGGKTEFDTYKS